MPDGAPAGAVLILAPTGRDSEGAAALLGREDIPCRVCPTLPALVDALDDEAGAALVADEALSGRGAGGGLPALAAKLAAQEPWSDLPFLVLTKPGAAGRAALAAAGVPEALGNAVFLERPLGSLALLSAVRSALRARRRQRQVRAQIAERAAAADRLARSEARLRMALEAGRLGAWELDLAGWRLAASATCKANFGRGAEDGFGYGDLLAAVHPEDRARMEAGVAAAIENRTDYEIEYRVLWPDGSEHWIEVRGRPAYAADGAPLSMSGVSHDVTERRRAEAELKRQEEALRVLNETLEARVVERTEELAAANRELLAQIGERERVEATLHQMQRLEAVGQLTSGVAHDFNNLLTVVLGNIGFLQRRAPDADAARRLETMRTAAGRGAKLVAQLLAFSRRQRLEGKPTDLNEMLSGMRDLLSSTMGGAVRLEIEQAPGLWPALVDPTQIELVVLNLAINARDAMEVGGTLRIETANALVPAGGPRRAGEPGPGEYVAVAVSDTGTGMAPEVLAKAFEPFFTTKPVGKGSGLGLAQVYGFAEQSGGGVRIETELGRGTTVRVFLPRVVAAARAADGTDGEAARAARRPVPAARDGGRRTVLLVDDDGAVRDVAATILREGGHEVVEAGSGGAALEALAALPRVDLMVIDFAMPGMNGAEVARQARARHPGLPVLFLTGYADLAAVAALGTRNIIGKPFTEAEFKEKAAAAMAGRGEPRDRGAPAATAGG